MKDIQDIVQSLNIIELPNGEILYSFIEFYEEIKKMCKEYIGIDDCIITPYYIFKERRLELYEYELNIRSVEKPDFEKYILSKTGKFKMDDIPKEVILLQKNCYFEILKTERKIPIKKIQQYIDYLCNSENLKSQVQQVFGEFNVQGLWFEFY